MKLLIPVLGFGKAGGYRVLSRLANEIIRRGHEVYFLAPAFSDAPYYPSEAKILWVDKKGRLCPQKPVVRGKGNFATIFYCLYRGVKKSGRLGFDSVLANHSFTTFPIYFSRVPFRKFYYIQAYEPEYYDVLSGIKNRLFSFLSRKSYRLPFLQIVNSHIYSSYKGIRSAHVVYPGIDLNVFRPDVKVGATQQPEKWRIGTVARSEPQKGTQFIVEAFELIRKKLSNVELVLAFGDEKFAGNNIQIVQPHGDENLADFYRSLDIYISAGTVQHGAVHYPVLEAMACGTSVITTDYFPATEANAFMIVPASARAIAEAVQRVMDDPGGRVSRINKGLTDAAAFSWDQAGEKMVSIMTN